MPPFEESEPGIGHLDFTKIAEGPGDEKGEGGGWKGEGEPEAKERDFTAKALRRKGAGEPEASASGKMRRMTDRRQ